MAIDPKLRNALKEVVAARARAKAKGAKQITFGAALTKSSDRTTPPIYDERNSVNSWQLEEEGLIPEADALKEYESSK